jgi:hypothetical protein
MFPRSSLASAANSLALWGRLSSAQKMASRSESGIGLDNLTPEQAELMLKAATMTLQSCAFWLMGYTSFRTHR